MDCSLFQDYIINPSPDMIAGERDMYGTLNVAWFAHIREVFGPAIMFCDNLLRNLVGFKLFVVVLALFLLLRGRLL